MAVSVAKATYTNSIGMLSEAVGHCSSAGWLRRAPSPDGSGGVPIVGLQEFRGGRVRRLACFSSRFRSAAHAATLEQQNVGYTAPEPLTRRD